METRPRCGPWVSGNIPLEKDEKICNAKVIFRRNISNDVRTWSCPSHPWLRRVSRDCPDNLGSQQSCRGETVHQEQQLCSGSLQTVGHKINCETTIKHLWKGAQKCLLRGGRCFKLTLWRHAPTKFRSCQLEAEQRVQRAQQGVSRYKIVIFDFNKMCILYIY